MNKRLVCIVTLLYLCAFTTTVLAANIDTKYMHLRPVVIDGDNKDWSSVRHTVFDTEIRRQEGALATINGTTFLPGNVTFKQGGVLSWKNQDTVSSNDHQIALGVTAPITFTSAPLTFGDTDYVTINDVSDFDYHTSRVQFPIYPDGNVSVTANTWTDFQYSIAFASSQTKLFISFTFFNVSENGASSGKYVRRIDIILDDYADGVLEGDNVVQIEKDSTMYEGKDMFYDVGLMEEDTSVGESDDVRVGHKFTEPEVDGSSNYQKDLFIEVEMPINSFDLKDLGSAPGEDIGVLIIARISDSDQDADASLPGVQGYYQGGGHPIILTQSEGDASVLDLDPDDFIIVNLSGESLVEIIETIFQEMWIVIVGGAATVMALIFGFTIKKKREEDIAI